MPLSTHIYKAFKPLQGRGLLHHFSRQYVLGHEPKVMLVAGVTVVTGMWKPADCCKSLEPLLPGTSATRVVVLHQGPGLAVARLPDVTTKVERSGSHSQIHPAQELEEHF